MHRQRLDFAHPQPAVKLGGQLAGGLVLAASLALAAGLVVRYQELSSEMVSVEMSIARLTRANAPERVTRGMREAVAGEVSRVNQAAVRLTIPWEDLFKTVEAAIDKRVALLSLQPNFQKRELKITGEAEDYGAILQYISRLESGGALAEVRLISHELTARQGPAQVRFELAATWRLGT